MSVAEPELTRDLATRLARRGNGWPTLTGGGISDRLYARAERAVGGPLALASAVAQRFETAGTTATPGALPLARPVVGGTWSEPAIETPGITEQGTAAELPSVSPARRTSAAGVGAYAFAPSPRPSAQDPGGAPGIPAATAPEVTVTTQPPDAPLAGARRPATYADATSGAADASLPGTRSGASGPPPPTPPGAGAPPIVVHPMPATRSASPATPLSVAGSASAAQRLESAQDPPAAPTGVDAPPAAPSGVEPAPEPRAGTSTGGQAEAAPAVASAQPAPVASDVPVVQPEAATRPPAGEGLPVVEPVIPASRQTTLPAARFSRGATSTAGEHAGAQPLMGPAQAGPRQAVPQAPRQETERIKRRSAGVSPPPTSAISPERSEPTSPPLAASPAGTAATVGNEPAFLPLAAAPTTAPAAARSEPTLAPLVRAEPAGTSQPTPRPLARAQRERTDATPAEAREAEVAQAIERREDATLPTAAHAVPSVAARPDADPAAAMRDDATLGAGMLGAAGPSAALSHTLVQRTPAHTAPARSLGSRPGAPLPVVRASHAGRSASGTGLAARSRDAEPAPAATVAAWSAPLRALIRGRRARDSARQQPQPAAPPLALAPPSPPGLPSGSGPPSAAAVHGQPAADGGLVLATQPPSGSLPRSAIAASVPIEPPAAPAPSAARAREPDAEALAEQIYGLIVRRLGHERARRGR